MCTMIIMTWAKILRKHTSLRVFGASDGQYVFSHQTLDVTAGTHAVPYISIQASLNSLTI